MKDIIILADFCGPLDGTFNSRFLYLADLLAKDNKVEIVTSDFDHGRKNYFEHEIEKHDYPITMLHEAAYPRNVCLRRFFGHYIWGRNVRKYLEKRKKPDVIYCAIPTLYASYEAALYCEKVGSKFVIDIQDIWPEAFQMVFNVPVISWILFKPFEFLADSVYKKADAICAVSDTYCKRALEVNKKCTKSTTVFLGTELTTFDKYAKTNPVLEKKDGDIWIAYCGTLGSSYDLTCVIDALKQLGASDKQIEEFKANCDNEVLSFVQERLNSPDFSPFADGYLKSLNKVNSVFVGRLRYSAMCSLLSACDITVNPITHLAAQSIINKHADYAASGHPVVSTQENEEYRRLIDEYQMGYNCKNSDSSDLAEKIRELANDADLRSRMGDNARKCAEERFDRAATYKLLERQILTKRGGIAD